MKFETKLTDAEKLAVTRKMFELKRDQPALSWKAVILQAKQILPNPNAIPESILSPSAYGWMDRALKQLGEESGTVIWMPRSSGHKKSDTAKQSPESIELEKIRREFVINCLELVKKGDSWTKATAACNHILPEGSRIVVPGPSSSSWMKRIVKELKANPIPAPVAEPAVVEAIAPEPPVPVVAETEKAPEVVVTEPIPTPPQTGLMTLENALIQAIVSTVQPIVMNIIQSPRFAEALRGALWNAPLPKVEPFFPKVTSEPRKEKKKIMILGMEAEEKRILEKEYGQVFDLRIFDKNVPTDSIRNNLKNCEQIIVMTKHIGHRITDCLKGRAGLMYCNGNTSALKTMLQSLNAH